MKFKFVKQVAGEVPSYGGNVVKTGDVIDLDGPLAKKAAENPDYVIVEYLGGHTPEEGTITRVDKNSPEEVKIVHKYQKRIKTASVRKPTRGRQKAT